MTALILDPNKEAERLEALRRCQILDTDPEEAFDDLTRLAAHICGVPISAVSLVDEQRQWFKSIRGLPITQTGRDEAFCAHTIGQPDVMIIPDAHEDLRFVDNPLVTGGPNIRFYAGAPLVTEEGHALGSLCVIDRVPRQLTPEQESALRLLARQATIQLEMARHAADQERLIAERAQVEAALRRSEARLNEAQRVARVGSWEFDIATARILWSEQLFRMFEIDPADGAPSVDALMARYHPDDVPMHQEITFRAVEDGLPYEFDIRILRTDRSVHWVHASGRGERDEKGDIVRLVGTVADIHDRKCAEEKLRKSEESLVAAQRVAKVGSWELDVVTGRVTWSKEMFRMIGRDPALGEPDYSEAVALYHPEDTTALHALVARAIEFGEDYDIDLRRANTGGPTQWFNAVGRAVKNEAGQVVRLVGTLADITERVVSEERFRILFECSSDAHLLLGETGVIDCNPAAVTLLGCADKTEILALHPAVLSPEFQPDGRPSAEKSVEMDRLAHENGYHRFEWVLQKKDGEEFPAEVTLTPVTLHDRSVLLVVMHDLSDRKKAEQQAKDYAIVLEFQMDQLEVANAELEALATTDGLTGLKNHRAFQERLAEEIDRADRQGAPVSVILLDVDKFKQYNDSYGHPAGDDVLRKVARLLRSGARETDMIARYGGEEFILVLSQTDRLVGQSIAERIRRAIEEAAWPLRPVTASFGVATFTPGSVACAADLVARADQALYRSKQAGRNRVTVEHQS